MSSKQNCHLSQYHEGRNTGFEKYDFWFEKRNSFINKFIPTGSLVSQKRAKNDRPATSPKMVKRFIFESIRLRKLDGNSNQAQEHADEIAKSKPFYMRDIPKDQQIIEMVKETDMSRLNLKACFEIYAA